MTLCEECGAITDFCHMCGEESYCPISGCARCDTYDAWAEEAEWDTTNTVEMLGQWGSNYNYPGKND